MKKITFIFLAGLIMLGQGCSKNDAEEPEVPNGNITFSTTETPVFGPVEGSQTFSFTSDTPWEISRVKHAAGAGVWCKVSPERGEAGKATVTISVYQNTTLSDRTAEIIITGGKLSKPLPVL